MKHINPKHYGAAKKGELSGLIIAMVVIGGLFMVIDGGRILAKGSLS